MTVTDPDDIRLAEQHRLLWSEYTKLNEGLPAYVAIAGGILTVSGVFGPGGEGTDHPMFLLGAGVVLFFGAGSYWLWVRGRAGGISKEMRAIEDRFRRKGLRVSNGHMTPL